MVSIIAYAYEAAYHCPSCARKRFGLALDDPNTADREGNPIHPVFEYDDIPSDAGCDECFELLLDS